MRFLSFVLPVFVLLAVGCVSPPNPPELSGSVPSDLEVVYSYGACHAEWGRTNVVITADGNMVFESGSGSYRGGRFEIEDFREIFRLSEGELLGLLNKIETSGFYSLRESYFNPDIVDGSCNHLSVTKNGQTKIVSVSNVEPPEGYSKVVDLIASLVEEKTE